jgi:uncharacterized membrane protein YdjX (TVP38/TMEM64 family)
MIGWMVGGVAAYFIGSWAGYPVVVKIMSREKVDTWQDLASRRINFYFALLFRLAMPAETGYVFGLARYNFGKFMLATFLVESLTGAILVWGGDALLAQDFMRFAALIAGGIIVFSVAAYLFWRKWRPTR